VAVHFTSDQHFGHQNIIAYSGRPFRDAAHMAEELVARHNAVVRAHDDVYHLGDFSLDERLVGRILPRLHGRHHLICGNHDACHPCHRRGDARVRSYIAAGFVDVCAFGELELPGVGSVDLCHMPYDGDHTARDRFPEHRPADRGRWLLHGHVHELWKVRGRMINVGVDHWDYAPVSAEAIAALIAEHA
jgi:calcineurin-like phosphoesterase family protein